MVDLSIVFCKRLPGRALSIYILPWSHSQDIRDIRDMQETEISAKSAETFSPQQDPLWLIYG